jgi:hypothetical protein
MELTYNTDKWQNDNTSSQDNVVFFEYNIYIYTAIQLWNRLEC